MEDKKELLKKELVEELAAEVTFAAEVSDWEEQKGRENWGDVPLWFGRAVIAARTVLTMDEALGMKCLETLRAATEGADAEQRLAALGMLINSISYAEKAGGVVRSD